MGESPKVEARLNVLMRTALGLYMQDRHLDNESEVLRSALGQFLDSEGYIAKAARALGISPARVQEIPHTPGQEPEKPGKQAKTRYPKVSRKRTQ